MESEARPASRWVSEDLLRHYERVSKFRGSGISEVRDHKCMACQVMLRPQTYNDVRSGKETVVCDSCQRILYFNPKEELVDQKPGANRAKRHHPKIDASQAWYYRPSFWIWAKCFSASPTLADKPVGACMTCIPAVRSATSWFAKVTSGRRSRRYYRSNAPQRELERRRTGWFRRRAPDGDLDSLNSDLALARHEAASGSHAKTAVSASSEQAAS